MDLLMFAFVAAIPVISDGFTVHGPFGPLVAHLGSSVVLPCYVDKPLPTEGLEVRWRRTDSEDSETDSETLVHLFLDGESRAEAQHQDYEDRAHFFTDQIQHGNFSLRLDNLRAEDKGKYTCTVYSDQDSGETVAEIKVVEHLLVSGSSRSIFAYDGEDVTLNCSVDSHITPEHIEEVSWKRTDGDILVLLYQNNEIIPDSADEQYRDRAEFFTDEIHKGNFSLRLKSVRFVDKGVYMCQVFAGDLSANAIVVLQTSFPVSHIMMLILCISASGSALLLCIVIYCRSQNTDPAPTKRVRALGFLHVFLPNIMMFVAFVLWGLTEGFLYETVCCCALYILRPLMLIYVAPYLEKMSGVALLSEFVIFMIVHCSVIFGRAWEPLDNKMINRHRRQLGIKSDPGHFGAEWPTTPDYLQIYNGTHKLDLPSLGNNTLLKPMGQPTLYHDPLVNTTVYQEDMFFTIEGAIIGFGFLTPFFVVYIIYILTKVKRNPCHRETCKCLWDKVTDVAVFSYFVLPSLQFILMFVTFVRYGAGPLYIFIFPVLFILSFSCLRGLNREKSCSNLLANISWIIFMFIITAVVLFIYFIYFMVLFRLQDWKGWFCMAIFYKMLWMITIYTDVNKDMDLTLTLKKVFYVFGSVVVVIVNSVTLMTELILKTVNDERPVGDLRVVAFSSESIFTFFLLIFIMFGPWFSNMKCLQCCQNASKTLGNGSMQKTEESHEMNHLLKNQDPEAGIVAEETQPDSV